MPSVSVGAVEVVEECSCGADGLGVVVVDVEGPGVGGLLGDHGGDLRGEEGGEVLVGGVGDAGAR